MCVCVYTNIYFYIAREMVDLVNLTRFEKTSGKLDEQKYRQRIQ